MPLAPGSRSRLFAAGAAALAVWLSFGLAQGEYLFPALIGAMVLLFLAARWQPFPLAAVLLGLIVFGYVVGNRGFAQLALSPSFPLLPAEGVLLVAGSILLVQLAWRHELPFQRDALNILLLAWIAAGVVRMMFDFGPYRFTAVRDFATVYYALFFFLAQEVATDPRCSRALMNVLLGSALVLFVVQLCYSRCPDFFLGVLTVRGLPLIFYKGDLAATFLGVGSVLAFLRFQEGGPRAWVALSLALAASVFASGNRASMLGLGVAALWLLARRRWQFAATLGAAGAAAAVLILAAAALTNTSWERTPLYAGYERAVSIVDPSGKRVYRGTTTSDKGDNNLFRTVWWRAVYEETMAENPYVGLGFGRDLAARFVREYYADSTEEFSTRSPHNILLTVFARMGAVGLLLFLAIVATMASRTWRAIAVGPHAAAPWCATWVILTSACFGVVLEGPMGAVVFWTTLGIAQAGTLGEPVEETAPAGVAGQPPAALPPAAATRRQP